MLDEPVIAPSAPVPQNFFATFRIVFPVTFLFSTAVWLYCIYSSVSRTVVAVESPVILTVGVSATGVFVPSNPICCPTVPVIITSLPLASVVTTAFAVNPVLVPHAILSLVLERVLIELVLPAMRPESVSSADLIAPEIDPRVNICASVILDVAYVSCLATTVSIIDS